MKKSNKKVLLLAFATLTCATNVFCMKEDVNRLLEKKELVTIRKYIVETNKYVSKPFARELSFKKVEATLKISRLYNAVKNRDIKLIKKLLSNGADPNLKSHFEIVVNENEKYTKDESPSELAIQRNFVANMLYFKNGVVDDSSLIDENGNVTVYNFKKEDDDSVLKYDEELYFPNSIQDRIKYYKAKDNDFTKQKLKKLLSEIEKDKKIFELLDKSIEKNK